MIGLVLVSHSAQLAEGAMALAQQMTQGNVPIAAAGGIDDDENPIGTDPMKVLAAIESVYSEDGVVILMDLGSALMSAETALDFVDPDWLPNIYLSDAPLVEGAVAAAVQAGIGSDIHAVLNEARTTLQMKQQHLAPALQHTEPATPHDIQTDEAISLRVIVPNKLGLHARPAARLVTLAGQHNATLTIQKGKQTVSARSINQVALLSASQGDELIFHASGPEAEKVLTAVQALADKNFGDRDDDTPANKIIHSATAPADVITGIPASRGLALGSAFRLEEYIPEFETFQVDNITQEKTRLADAIAQTINELQDLIEHAKIGRQEAAIFNAHILILEDPDLTAIVHDAIQASSTNAEAAWWEAIEATAASYRQTDNEYLQARAADVLDVGKRVLRKLIGSDSPVETFSEKGILIADDLAPSDTAQLDPTHIKGIITRDGGATSHTAIIARSLGIPAVVGVGESIDHIIDGHEIALDGEQGWIWPQPSATQIDTIKAKIKAQQTREIALKETSSQPAITIDGRRIEIAANIGKAADSELVLTFGAEGVGLFRTELLFMDRPTAPTEDEQFTAYVQVAENLNGGPIIIRTLDVGGDKPIGYIDIGPEENPFLGFRGIRYWLNAPEIALTQLRAICRASASHPIKVMFPMVGTLDELMEARSLLRQVWDELDAKGISYNPDMEVGIMIEVPSVVITATQFAPTVDFFSIGTNDLTQYIMAADRGNPRVNNLISPFQPAVIRAIHQVIEAAHQHNKWVGICGEMAGNPVATRLLVGLGIDELSMSAPGIPEVKAKIRETDYTEAQKIAQHALTLTSADEVLQYLRSV